MRIIWFLFGIVFVMLSIIGALLPVIPGFVFLLLAIVCFARSSKRFSNWLVNNKLFGKHVRDFINKNPKLKNKL